MDDKTLLPCPFCGGVPKSYWQGDSIDQDCGYWAVECCHIHVHTDDEAEAIAAWNTRAPQATRIEALEAALQDIATGYNGYAARIIAKQALESKP